jgi:alpha-ketoglutarate-dependent taurine dioxygenase
VGRTGWHIDGSFQEKPFSHALYHIIGCPTDGATVFAPLTDIVESLPAEKRCWCRFYTSVSAEHGFRIISLILE